MGSGGLGGASGLPISQSRTPFARKSLPVRPPAFLCAPFLSALLLCALLPLPAPAQEISFFRIGTGAISETHFPVGGLIANVISRPPGSRPCDKGGSCGVEGLVAVAQSTHGSVANIQGIEADRLEAALVTADVAHAALTGTGPFAGKPALKARAVAMLFPDTLHLVVRADAGIDSLKDLRGKRVALGEKGSGTLVDAEIVLGAHGLRLRDIKEQYLRPGAAADLMAKGGLDAMFVLDGAPVPAIQELALSTPVRLIPIAGPPVDKLRDRYPFFRAGSIPASTYQGVDEPVASLDVGLVLMLSSEVDDETAYGLTRALWHPASRKILASGHPRAAALALDADLELMGLPLHPGAKAYYLDMGLLP